MKDSNVTAEIASILLSLIRVIVDTPEDVTVTVELRGADTILRVQVAASDVGWMIGRQGRTARSLRTILQSCSMKYKQKFLLDIEGKPTVPSAAPNGQQTYL